MNGPDELYQMALAADPEQALDLLARLLDLSPGYPNAAYRLGMLQHQLGELADAEANYQRELGLRPDFWACRANLAQLYFERLDYPAAATAIAAALDACALPEARSGLLQLQARIQRAAGENRAALASLQQAQALEDGPGLQRDLARLCLQLGESGAAARHYQRALLLGPSILLRREAAEFLISVQRFPEAISILEELIKTGGLPHDQQALLLGQIANAWQELNRPEQALASYEQALELDPRDSLRLARSLVLPVVYSDEAEIAAWRVQLKIRLQALGPLNLPEPLELGVLPFYAPYQGFNDKELMSLLGDALTRSLSHLDSGGYLSHRRGRLRIGCVSHFFFDHSVMRCFADLLLELTQPPFELHLISASPLLADDTTRRMQTAASSWTRLQGPLPVQLEQIRALDLDLLLYTDMGLDPHSYLLAQFRLAPLQILLPGQPVTSGLGSIDGFVSDRLSEPEAAQAHYREPLLLLNRLPTIYPRPQLPEHLPDRSQLGLPEGRLYLCPGQAFKLHPAMDAALVQILEADPEGCLLLLDLTPNGLIQSVRARLQAKLSPAAWARVRVLPRRDSDGFFALLGHSQVMLESFPFGSVNTLMAAFAVGTPVVTLPGNYLRGRYCLGMYRQMGIAGPVAATPEEYARLALDLAHDEHARQNLSREIRQAHSLLFANRAVGDEFRQLLLKLIKP
ncbi:MAG: tetratricopeptide repeat protein [Candidatus Sericytochromatia bacterium]